MKQTNNWEKIIGFNDRCIVELYENGDKSKVKQPELVEWAQVKLNVDEICQDWEVGNIDDKKSFKSWKKMLVEMIEDLLYGQHQKSYKAGAKHKGEANRKFYQKGYDEGYKAGVRDGMSLGAKKILEKYQYSDPQNSNEKTDLLLDWLEQLSSKK